MRDSMVPNMFSCCFWCSGTERQISKRQRVSLEEEKEEEEEEEGEEEEEEEEVEGAEEEGE